MSMSCLITPGSAKPTTPKSSALYYASALLVLFVAGLYTEFWMPVSEAWVRSIRVNDPRYLLLPRGDTVPPWVVITIGVTGFGYIPLLWLRPEWMSSLRAAAPGGGPPVRSLQNRLWRTAAFLCAGTVSWIILNVVKCSVGEPRPQFLPRTGCVHNLASDAAGLLIDLDSCTFYKERPNTLRRVWLRSFPSGHAWMVAFPAAWLILEAKVARRPCAGDGGPGDETQSQSAQASVALAAAGDGAAPLRSPCQTTHLISAALATVLVGISRVMDHKHHPHDVACGWLVGCVAALTGHRVFSGVWGGEWFLRSPVCPAAKASCRGLTLPDKGPSECELRAKV